MRYTKFNLFQVSGFILGFFSLIGCGSYQNSAYYSDGIYGSRDVVVVRRQVEQPVATNSYSQYFDEKAKEYLKLAHERFLKLNEKVERVSARVRQKAMVTKDLWQKAMRKKYKIKEKRWYE